MTNLEAKKRYFRVFTPAMAIYLITFLLIAWFADNVGSNPVLISIMALVPIIALLAMFWAHMRMIGEIDEFLRSIQIRAVFAGLSAVLVVATGWGILELLANMPVLAIFWINPIYWIAYGLAAAYFTRRETGQFE